MANLLINTTVGGNAVITTSNIGSYALTSITSGNVTTALGYTPYNATNPSGYITSSALSSYLPLTGGTVSGVTNFSSTVNMQATSWFGGYGPGSGPGIAFENLSSFVRFAFWGLDFYDWNHGIQMTIDNAYVSATNSFRAPIFYDSNDTTYYGDFAGTSNLYNLSLTGAKNTYLTINPGNGYEAMVRYIGGSGSGWYVGKRMSGDLVNTASFHFFSEAAGATVAGIDTGGNFYTTGYLTIAGTQLTGTQTQLLKNTLDVTTLPYKVDITVNGDANTFYAVQFWGGDQDVWRRIIIKRGYGETAPWDPIGSGVHHGGLLLDWEGNFGGWGGAEYADRIRVFNESYTNVCADMFIYSHSMGYVFMLRGGGAIYHLFSDQPINGYYQGGAPDILYSASTLSYDDNWSGTNVYDVYAPTPLTLGQVNSSRIDGLRTKKQSLLDGRYLRQGVDISGIGTITTTNSYATNYNATNYLATNAYYLNGTSYYLNSTNGGIYTNARFETASNLFVGGNSYLGNGNGDETHINDILRVGATDSGDAHFYFGEGSLAGSDYGSHWYWDSGYTFTWNTRNNGTDTALFDYVTNDTTYLNWRRNFHMQNREINYVSQLHFNAGTRFVGNTSSYLNFQTDSTTVGGIIVRDGNSSVRGYADYFDSSGFGLLNSTGNWGIRLNPGNVGTELYYAGSLRLDTRSGGVGVQGNLYTNADYGYGLVGLYSATRYQGVFAMSNDYKLLADGTGTGNLYGIAWTHTNVGGQSKTGLDHQALFMTNGITQTAIGTGIWTSGLITTTSYGTSSNWNTAFGWGNHASAGYLTSITSTQVTNALGYTPYNSTNPNGYITGISFANVSSKPTTISGYGITDAITTANIGSQSVTNSAQLNGLSKIQLWNNSGQGHSTYQTFGAIPNFGVWFMQNSAAADTPQSGSQYYVQTQGLGNDYGYGTAGGNYALMTAVARDHARKYTYYRNLENGGWGSWSKGAAGYADEAGVLSSMNISQFTNNSGYITGYTETDTLATVTGRGSTTSSSITAERYRGNNSLILNSFTTVNPSSNVFLYSQPNDRDSWIYLDSADTGSNWGIYHRQIDSAVGGMEGNSIGFIGGGANGLRAYIGLSTGNGYFAGTLSASNLSGTNTGDQTNISGNAATATLASTVTINYNNDSNSSYQLLWGSGNSVYGTANIYVNPSSDTIYATAYRGNANVAGTGEAIYAPAGVYSTGTNWLYGTMYVNGNSINDVSEIKMYTGPTLQVYNDRNLIVKGSSSSDAGIEGRNAAGSNVFQIYGSGSDYGFLNGTWAAWDIRKTKNGALYMNDAGGYYLYTNGTSNFYALNIQGSAVVHAGNIGSQSVSYASTAGSADQIDGWGFVNTGSNNATNADTINSNGISYYSGGVTNFSGNATDGALYSQRYSDSWQHQIAGDFRSGMIAVRGKNNGTWTSWKTIIDSSTIGSQSVSYATTAGALTSMNISQFSNNSGYLTSLPSHNHDDRYFTESESDSRYLRFTGAELTEGNYFYFRSNRGAYLGGLDSPSLQAYATGGNAAFMSFHRGGNYAVNFGLDSDNIMRIGGWSAPADRWVLDMSGNNTVAGSFRAPIFYDSENTNYYVDPNSTSRINSTIIYGGTGGTSPRLTFMTTDDGDTNKYIGMVSYWTQIGCHVNEGLRLINSNGVEQFYVRGGTSGNEAWFRGNVTASGILYASGGNSSNWNTAFGWGNHASAGYLTSLPSHNHDDRYYTETESDARYPYYRGYSTSGNTQTFQSTANTLRFDQVGALNGSWSNQPTGYYTYGGILSLRGENFGLQIYGSHTGDLAFKTQWDNDQYSGWRTIIHSANIGSQSVSYATTSGALTSMNISQFTNNSGYITGYTETDTLNSITNRGNTTSNSVRFGSYLDISPTTSAFRFYDGTTFRGGFGLDSWGHSGSDANLVLYVNGDNTLFFSTSGTKRASLSSSAFNSLVALQQSGNQVLHAGNYTSYSPSLTGSGASGSWSINVTGSSGSAGNATNLSGLGSIQSTSTGTSYTANYQIRENSGGGGNTNEIYAPQLAFHWSGVVASSIMMESSGRMAIRNNPGGSYENFIAAVIYSSGYGDSTQWNTAYGWGNHASAGYQAASTAITTSNIGSQSVSNASTAGGLAVHSSRNNEVNKIVRTDANGYIQAGWINTTSGAFSSGINKIYCSDDDYIRYQTPANFISNLGLITTSNIGSQSVSYATTAGTANAVAWGNVSSKPSYIMYYQGFTLDANTMDANSTGFTYSVNAPFTGPIARLSEPGYSLQFNAAYSGGGTGIAFRTRNGDTASFNTWRVLLNDSNYTSYSPSLTGSGASGSWGISVTGSAGSVAWTNVSSRPTALSQFTNDLGNYGGWITSSGSISGNAATATSATYLNNSNYIVRCGTSGNANTDFQNTPAGSVRHNGDDANLSNSPGGTWWFYDNYRHSNGSNHWGTQVAWGWEDNANRLATRNITGGNFGSWVYYLNSSNFTSYAPSLTGSGASGTWSINVTGSAGSATSAGSVPASGITGQTGMWTSAARPGAYRLYRNDSDDPYNVQTTWSADKASHWSLRGYYNDSYHAPCYVASSGFADNAGQLNTYGYLVGDNWDTYYTSGKLRVASASGATGTGRPPSSVHNYGSLLSYGISGEDMFQMYFPDNAGNSIANSRKLHYRTGRGTWCDWRTVVDMVGDTLTIVEGGTPKIVVRGSVPYGQPTSASIELVGDADNGQTKSYRWISTAPDWNGQDLKLERYSINNGYQLVGRVPKNTYNLEWQGTITQGLSDSRVKTNVVSMTEGLDKIDQIRPVTFDWVPTENVSDREGADFGFIAQELEEVLPEVVHTRGDGYKTVMYEKVVPVLVQAMKEQQTMIEALRAEIELLKNK
jgi:hypothetical protein